MFICCELKGLNPTQYAKGVTAKDLPRNMELGFGMNKYLSQFSLAGYVISYSGLSEFGSQSD